MPPRWYSESLAHGAASEPRRAPVGLRTNFCIWVLRMEEAGAYISSVCPGCPSEVSIWRRACLGVSFDVFPRAFFGDLAVAVMRLLQTILSFSDLTSKKKPQTTRWR